MKRLKLSKFESTNKKEIKNTFLGYYGAVLFSNDEDKCKIYTYIKHRGTENTGISPLKSEGSTYKIRSNKKATLLKAVQIFIDPQLETPCETGSLVTKL